jgi:predicted aspartyl protease
MRPLDRPTAPRLLAALLVALAPLGACATDPSRAPVPPPPEGIPDAEAALYTGDGAFSFANGRDARDIPFELNSDKIYLQVRLNGQGPFWLMLDTGSPGMVLDTATAETLGLPLGETGETVGAGEATFPLTEVEIPVDAELPGLRLTDQPAAVGPLDRVIGPFEGRALEGILGCHNLMTRFVVEIDYARRRLHFVRPEDFVPGDGARIVPLELEQGHPFVQATLQPLRGEPIPGRFLVDTGMRRQMLLTTPFVDRHDLLERSAPTVYTTTGGGIGGRAQGHVGRMRSVRFGEVTVEDFPATLSQVRSGLVATDFAAGVIGAAVLQRYRVAFDYGRERLVFQEQPYDADDLDYDKSGLFLVADFENRSLIRVLDVVPGSPAAKAGIEVGDRLIGMAGAPLGETALERVRRTLRGPEGTEVDLALEREGELLRVRLRLRPVV